MGDTVGRAVGTLANQLRLAQSVTDACIIRASDRRGRDDSPKIADHVVRGKHQSANRLLNLRRGFKAQ